MIREVLFQEYNLTLNPIHRKQYSLIGWKNEVRLYYSVLVLKFGMGKYFMKLCIRVTTMSYMVVEHSCNCHPSNLIAKTALSVCLSVCLLANSWSLYLMMYMFSTGSIFNPFFTSPPSSRSSPSLSLLMYFGAGFPQGKIQWG